MESSWIMDACLRAEPASSIESRLAPYAWFLAKLGVSCSFSLSVSSFWTLFGEIRLD